MPLYAIADKNLTKLDKTTYPLEGLQERYDLQEAIKHNIDIVSLSLKNFLTGKIVAAGLIYWLLISKQILLLLN